VNGLFAVHCAFAWLGFSLNTFAANTWHMWSPWLRIRRRWLAWPILWARVSFPFRAVHAYGVFPPQTGPAARLTLVLEASWDEQTWHELSFRYWPTHERSAPKWCAPHHERFDQAVVYEAVGVNEQSVFRGIAGRFDPYSYDVAIPRVLMHRILAGTDASYERFYDRSLLHRLGAPRVVRVRTHILEPTSLAELRATGRYWTRELAGPHLPPVRLHEGFWDAPPTPPELWHFEDRVWLARSRVGDLMRESERGMAVDALVRRAAPDLTDEDIRDFWEQFVPSIPRGLRSSWRGLRAHVERYREQYGDARLYRFERIANLYALMLFARLEPLYLDQGVAPLFGKATPSLDVKSNYHLHLLTHQIVAEGRALFDEMCEEPRRACGYAAGLNLYASQVFHALLRYEKLVYQSQKLRLLDLGLKMAGRTQPSEKQRKARERAFAMLTRAFGAIEVAEFLTREFTNEEDVLDIPECWPSYRILPSGRVERVSALAQTARERQSASV
jgi:Lipase maturation factor